MENKYWGYHLILDCAGCRHSTITDPDNIKKFIKHLIEEIDMVAYGEPIVAHFATHDPDKAGWTFVQLIETSNITGHFVDKDDTAYLDIFSCKEFDIEKAEAIVYMYFNPKNMRRVFLNRQAHM